MDSKDLAQALSQIIPFASLSETRPEITGIFMVKEKNDDTLKLVTTDSFRLAERKIFVAGKDKEIHLSIILPQKTAAELLHLLGGEGEVSINIDKNQVSFLFPEKELVSRLIEGAYPNYESLIPKEFTCEVTTNKDELVKTVRLVSLLSSRINDVHLKTDQKKGLLLVSARDPDLGESESSVKADLSGEEIEIHFNWHYLLEGLQQIEDKKVTLKFTTETKPALIRAASGSSNYFYIIMPIRA